MLTREQALKCLGFEHPLTYETKTRQGATTRILVEATVDYLLGRSVLIVGCDQTACRRLRGICEKYAQTIQALCVGMETGSLRTMTHAEFSPGTFPKDLRIYTDHFQVGGDLRVLGPFGEIRTAKIRNGKVETYDYDGNFLLLLTPDGLAHFETAWHCHPFTARDLDKQRWTIPDPVESSSSFQAPCRLKADGPIFTGSKTAPKAVDDRPTKRGDRILLTDQPKPDRDGIYIVVKKDYQGDTWVKSQESVEKGSMVYIHSGWKNEQTLWQFDGTDWLEVQSADRRQVEMAKETKERTIDEIFTALEDDE